MTKRLRNLSDLSNINRPRYNPSSFGIGIVHLGVGSFHKAHQAYYTDKVLEKSGGDWRIIGVSLRSKSSKRIKASKRTIYTFNQRKNGDNF